MVVFGPHGSRKSHTDGTPTLKSGHSVQKICLPLGGSLCSIMPKWQISTSVEIPLIDAISSKYSHPKDNKPHNSKSTCSSRLCHFSASQPAGMVISAPLLAVEAPRALLSGCRPTRPDDLDSMTATRERNKAQDVNVIFCLCAISKGKEMARPAPLRACSHDGFLL